MTIGPGPEMVPDRQQPVCPLSRDTLLDKTIRFGCGALLGMLIVVVLLGFVIGSGVDHGSTLLFGLCALLVAACGILAVRYGERFIVGLLRVMKHIPFWP